MLNVSLTGFLPCVYYPCGRKRVVSAAGISCISPLAARLFIIPTLVLWEERMSIAHDQDDVQVVAAANVAHRRQQLEVHTMSAKLQQWQMALYDVMQALAGRDDGWLRFIPADGGKYLYIKWKFTSGKFEGHYCFVSGHAYLFAKLLCKLEQQIEDAYDGKVRPTKDTPY